MAIIGILAALLLPALAYGKFRARVTTCTNNYKQLALAAAMYAGDDSKGRLPSFELPTESTQLVNFHNLYRWIVGLPMYKAMEPHGITQPQMWFSRKSICTTLPGSSSRRLRSRRRQVP